MQVGLLVQMGALVEMCSLVEQVSLVQERISPQWAHPAVTQHGFSWRLVDAVYTQTDGCSCHDGCLHKPKNTHLNHNANITVLTVGICIHCLVIGPSSQGGALLLLIHNNNFIDISNYS